MRHLTPAAAGLAVERGALVVALGVVVVDQAQSFSPATQVSHFAVKSTS